jgi:hypothetical protein
MKQNFKRQGTKFVKKAINPPTSKTKALPIKRSLEIDTFSSSREDAEEDEYYDNLPLNTFGVKQPPLKLKPILVSSKNGPHSATTGSGISM